MTDVLDHWIDGGAAAGTSPRTGDVFDPARGVVTKQVRLGSAADVDAAVASASKALAEWGQASIARRQGVMFAFRELLNARKGELAEILTAEHGKVFSDAQRVFNEWSKLPAEERTADRILKMLDFDFFELLDSVTIARAVSRRAASSFAWTKTAAMPMPWDAAAIRRKASASRSAPSPFPA